MSGGGGGSVAFVLHSHLPWFRRNGVFPVGEEWLFQSWSESYLPLLDTLERLAADGLTDVMTIGFTPVLAEQMADPYLLAEFHSWLGRRVLDLQWTMSAAPASDKAVLGPVWRHHAQRQARLLTQLEDGLLGEGLVAPFARLADAGVIELLGGPATHPYLPLMADPSLIRGQISAGLDVGEALTGRRPTGVWAPECGYRPAGPVGDPTAPPHDVRPDGTPLLVPSAVDLPGLEAFWAEAGVDHLVLDGPTLARPAGAADREWARTARDLHAVGDPLDVLDRPVWIADSDVAAFGRNLAVSYAVWNPHGGYPADVWYRDFHAIDLEGGFKSWRVTDTSSLAKQPYEPDAAAARVAAHADDFVGLLHAHLDPRDDDAVVVAAYDTELFGHWWYEGPQWLEAVLRRLADDPTVGTTTLAGHLARRPPAARLRLPESSWGWGKGHAAWVTDETRWIWQEIRAAEDRFATLADGPARDAAWRQLTMLQASDWPFMIARDQSTQYAVERVKTHLARFEQACAGQDLEELAWHDDPSRRPCPVPIGG
ncbi:1,4-alpha-glucan branching protein domain-containing protein [Euzebya sp.]|uniref:1,4-alpha-glucan branching protein domain-containing protein n=1 Tax=Euzebya sp. TaxID=1971409 RepID=UPI003518812F